MNRASRLFSINEIFPSPFPALLQTQTTSSRDADKSTRTRLDPEPRMRKGGWVELGGRPLRPGAINYGLMPPTEDRCGRLSHPQPAWAQYSCVAQQPARGKGNHLKSIDCPSNSIISGLIPFLLAESNPPGGFRAPLCPGIFKEACY